jgi:hypothetical protein
MPGNSRRDSRSSRQTFATPPNKTSLGRVDHVRQGNFMYALFDEDDFVLIATVDGDTQASALGKVISQQRQRAVVVARNCADGSTRICGRFVDGEQYAATEGGVTFRESRDP